MRISDTPGREPRALSDQIIEHLRHAEVFGTLSEAELERIAPLCREEVYHPQETVYAQGEPSERIYIVAEGAVSLIRKGESRTGVQAMMVTIDILKKGQVFGWTALIRPHVHTASAICQYETRVLAIDAAELRLTLEKNYHTGFEVMTGLAALLGERLRAAYRVLESIM